MMDKLHGLRAEPQSAEDIIRVSLDSEVINKSIRSALAQHSFDQ
jgi:hypothetical protein